MIKLPSFLRFLLQRRYDEYKQHYPRNPDEVWVTDLTRCWHRRELELEMPEIALAGVLNPRFIEGDLIHHAVIHEFDILTITSRMGGGLKLEIERELRAPIEMDGMDYTLIGHLDGLLVEKETEKSIEVIEIKTVKAWGKTMPYEHHVLQCKLYCYLAGCDRYRLIYVSRDGIREITDIVADPELALKVAIQTRASPKYPGWECDYCDYFAWCRVKRPFV